VNVNATMMRVCFGASARRWERVSEERPGNVLSETENARLTRSSSVETGRVVTHPDRTDGMARADAMPHVAAPDPDAEAKAFVRFCYRRRSVAWPELYDEMCAVAARGEYRGMDYEQLGRLGIGFALASLPRLAALADRVIAEERTPGAISAVA
jgi:hypothetical protein